MPSLVAAHAVLCLHLAFIAFVLAGAALVKRWRWLLVLHLPALLWGLYIAVSGANCPLTQLENHFLAQAGQAGYAAGFIEHYLLALIYPAGLTRELQLGLAVLIIGVNATLYTLLWRQRRRAPA